jgi:C_GCAxxG_C_C family probable redox protein
MENRQKLLEEVYRLAFENEMQYTGCSQTVLGALKEKFSDISEDVFKAGSVLAGGVARQGESCGALIGALMAVSAVCGRERLEDMDAYQKAMDPAVSVYHKFKEEIGDTICAEIHKLRYGRVYNLSLPEERQIFREIGCSNVNGCPVVCGTAARIAAEAILDIKQV